MTVDSGKTYRLSAAALYKIYKAFIDFSGENHLRHLNGFPVGDPQTVHKLGFFAHFGKKLGYFGSSAVDKHHPYPDKA